MKELSINDLVWRDDVVKAIDKHLQEMLEGLGKDDLSEVSWTFYSMAHRHLKEIVPMIKPAFPTEYSAPTVDAVEVVRCREDGDT